MFVCTAAGDLNKDLFAIIDAAKKNGYGESSSHQQQGFLRCQFLYRVIAAGAAWRIGCGSHPPLHDHLTRTAGSFQETVRGLENLAGFPEDKFVCIRIPVCKENYTDLGNTVATALGFGVNRIILSFEDHALSFQSALPHIHNAVI
jgi:hypothetical protein